MFTVTGIRHAWPEKAGFCLNRRHGHTDLTFVHFFNSVELELNGTTILTDNHACIFYCPGTPQHITSLKPLFHDWFHVTDVPESTFHTLNLPLDTVFYPQNPEFITGIIHEMEREFFAQNNHRKELIAAKMTEFLIKLSRACSNHTIPKLDPFTEDQLRNLRSEVLLSLHHPWTAAEMASHIPLSESRFYTLYRSFYGRSPIDDLIHARVDAAKNALLLTDHSIASIAESLGYNNVTHFIRQFHQLAGCSPSQYRKHGDSEKI